MPEKFVVRVINTQSLEQNVESNKPKPKTEIVVYHWHRIFAALFVLVVLLAGLIWGGLRIFKQSGEKPPTTYEQAANPAESATEPQFASQRPTELKQGSGSPLAAVTTGETKPIAPQQRTSADIPATGKQTENTIAPPVQPTSNDVADATVNTSVSILSASIKRAQLTHGIKDDEPVDTLAQTIPMNENGLVKVYLFMETAGLKGKVLYHDWYWKGKRIAHARIPIKRAAHTAVSSKFIDRIMTGPWEVKIVDERGNVLAKTAFEVR